MLDLVVQIVNYNSLSYTQNCLASLIKELDLCNLKYKIIIWDNNSDEDFQGWADKITDQRIKFYFSEQNIGFGQAHNAMGKFFESKYSFVLNPDTIIENNTVKNMYDFMENHPEAGMCGPRITLPGYTYFFHKDQFWPREFVIKDFFEKILGIKIWQNLSHLEHASIVGSVLFIRKEVFDKVGGFDPNYFLYFEEGDLENAIIKLGYKIYFLYNAQVVHYYGKSSKNIRWKIKIFQQSREYFRKKWKIKTTWLDRHVIDPIQNYVLRFYL